MSIPIYLNGYINYSTYSSYCTKKPLLVCTNIELKLITVFGIHSAGLKIT